VPGTHCNVDVSQTSGELQQLVPQTCCADPRHSEAHRQRRRIWNIGSRILFLHLAVTGAYIKTVPIHHPICICVASFPFANARSTRVIKFTRSACFPVTIVNIICHDICNIIVIEIQRRICSAETRLRLEECQIEERDGGVGSIDNAAVGAVDDTVAIRG
jgi:hypothetical protein